MPWSVIDMDFQQDKRLLRVKNHLKVKTYEIDTIFTVLFSLTYTSCILLFLMSNINKHPKII